MSAVRDEFLNSGYALASSKPFGPEFFSVNEIERQAGRKPSSTLYRIFDNKQGFIEQLFQFSLVKSGLLAKGNHLLRGGNNTPRVPLQSCELAPAYFSLFMIEPVRKLRFQLLARSMDGQSRPSPLRDFYEDMGLVAIELFNPRLEAGRLSVNSAIDLGCYAEMVAPTAHMNNNFGIRMIEAFAMNGTQSE